MTSQEAWLQRGLDALKSRGLHRELPTRTVDQRAHIDLSSNDYLGLTRHPRLIATAHAALDRWGVGATSSRLVAGSTTAHRDCERALAAWTGHEDALVFSSGYLANLGVISALARPGTVLIADEHIHASLHDAARLTRASFETFAHNDPASLRQVMDRVSVGRESSGSTQLVVMVESLYSVLGDQAKLAEFAELCSEYVALLVVDEAHALGVFGSGLVARAGLSGREDVLVTATLSKALGSQGGVVFGSSLLREFLINRARSFIFDTALAPMHAEVATEAVALLSENPSLGDATVSCMRSLAEQLGYPLGEDSPLMSVPMPSGATALQVRQLAAEGGVEVGVFRPPSTPDHVARLRLTASGELGPEQITRAASVIRQAIDSSVSSDAETWVL